MAESGFFYLYRGWWDNEIFTQKKICQRAAWIWLIENACWKSKKTRIAGKTIELNRGQLAYSIRFLAKAWGWHRSHVERFLNVLKTETMIGTQTETGITLITICNYDRYQAIPNYHETVKETPIGTAARQQRDKEELRELSNTVNNKSWRKNGKPKTGPEGVADFIEECLAQQRELDSAG